MSRSRVDVTSEQMTSALSINKPRCIVKLKKKTLNATYENSLKNTNLDLLVLPMNERTPPQSAYQNRGVNHRPKSQKSFKSA